MHDEDWQGCIPTDHFLNVQGIILHYLEWGTPTNPPILLLHGGSAHAHWWDHIASALANDFYVLSLDLRGHGDSAWSTGRPAYQIEDYVADLTAFVSLLALPPFVLIGHSLGGFIAMAYASITTQPLQALVVVDIGPRIGGSRFLRLLRQVPASIYTDEADLYARFRLLPAQTSASVALFRHIARHSVRAGADGYLTLKFDRATLAREPRSLRAQLADIQCPTLLLRGRNSLNLSAATFSEMLHLGPHMRGEEIPGSGHHIFLDTPQEFLHVVRSFVVEVKKE